MDAHLHLTLVWLLLLLKHESQCRRAEALNGIVFILFHINLHLWSLHHEWFLLSLFQHYSSSKRKGLSKKYHNFKTEHFINSNIKTNN